MKKKLHNFLNSDLLEKYVIGDTTDIESSKVESYINKYPEVQEEYYILQEQLEINARANAIKAPTDALDEILTTIHESNLIEMNSKPKVPYWFSIAASIAALVFAGTSYIFYTQSEELKEENNTIAEEIFDLRDDIDINNKKLDNVMSELKKLNDPETYKYVLRGNERAKDLKTVAYINPINKSSLIDVVSLPELSDEQYY
ncbi:MAG: RNA polymerase subunit sigma-70, partial [Bacteroidia bacterium]|nr:RNA polymerase subunit sigma-70 [Bacteroidia bacterium]